MAEITTSEILLSELPTKEVTLAPGQSTVVREIHTTIQPGQNEIIILGLDHRVNRDSIRIEGSGAATITDIQTSIIPQQVDFDDVYPPDSGDESLSDEDEEISEDEEGLNDPELQNLKKEIDNVESQLANAKGKINSSLAVLDILNQYGKGLHQDETKDVKRLKEFLELYSIRRELEGDRNHKATAEANVHEKDLAKLQKKFDRRKTRYLQEQRAASREIRLRNEKRARAREQRKKQRGQKRREQRHFWATTVGKVVVSLDGQSDFTPTSSRRSSVTEKVVDGKAEPIDVVLRLSYIVPGSGWSSRYELAINSPSSSAKMTYRAEFKNSSAETWRDTRLTLSTSQASFSGIGARIPTLDAWNIKLATAGYKSPSWDRILYAPDTPLFVPTPPPTEWSKRPSSIAPPPLAAQAQKRSLFAKLADADADSLAEEALTSQPPAQASSLFGSSTSGFGANTTDLQRGSSLFGNAAPALQSASLFGGSASQPQPAQSEGLFGSVSSQPQAAQQSRNIFAGQPLPEGVQQSSDNASNNNSAQPTAPSPAPGSSLFGGLFKGRKNKNGSLEETKDPAAPTAAVELEDDTDTQSLASAASLEHQDSVKQDYGMTTTYELPGRRTLAPSFVSRRHALAELDLKSVTLTYVIVPKYREAAFLRVRIKNTSSLTLHPGQVGITVDGSFIGSASIETCGPNVFFNISLGIDPGIEVKYAKPIVKPLASAKFFNKEDGAKFRRSCWVKNKKPVAVDLVVHDQVPVSDDERLGVRLLQPKGLAGERVSPVPINMEKANGSGTVSLLKDGKVKWSLRLEPREEIRLVLEYETKIPQGSEVACS
ncbi:uncharacterized protein BDV17DRAFT_263046 [Aspergillus undulatus]|uniref:uncharacterized protein n=1 Tax=Aspergillus undulatus TaxID=1810928 RepID=UPI003CCE2F86